MKKKVKRWWMETFPSAFWKSKDKGDIWIDEIVVYYSLS